MSEPRRKKRGDGKVALAGGKQRKGEWRVVKTRIQGDLSVKRQEVKKGFENRVRGKVVTVA